MFIKPGGFSGIKIRTCRFERGTGAGLRIYEHFHCFHCVDWGSGQDFSVTARGAIRYSTGPDARFRVSPAHFHHLPVSTLPSPQLHI